MSEDTTLTQALTELSADNDEHWTSEGKPKVGAVAEILGRDVTRAEIEEAHPDFERGTVVAHAVEEEAEVEVEKPKTQVEQLQDDFDAKSEELVEISRAMNELNERKKVLELQVNHVAGLLERIKGPSRNTTGVQDYLARQKEIREAKAARMADLQGKGVEEILQSVQPAPLDAAMKKRKPKHGEGRREFPHSITRG